MLSNLIAWLNSIANATIGVLFEPIAWTSGMLSIFVIGAVTGVLMLIAFKYTSNQSAIRNTRNQIKANLLGLSLFKDDLRVGLGMQGKLLIGAAKLLALSFVPMLVMIVPTCLVLSQLALWYQSRPLEKGEQAIVTLQTSPDEDIVSEIALGESPAFKLIKGPVRVPTKQMVCWEIEAVEPGLHDMPFHIGGRQFAKQLAIGERWLPVSMMRPASVWSDTLLHPREAPFSADSPVQSIAIAYPERASWTYGSHTWLVTWFLISMLAAFVAKPLLNVNI
ncbi:hypothetical protein [Blastopirellula marina]|uniref:Uncharacterized protein n=1 Tax=Blastopirellula marina TaxID=124 RepID=A0A2S8GAI5_9BACT|nr:hypothetical protein [Blastopirellula marina]PQO41104.1 hypothetical protein C5Y98_03865 [Blastopirellula marina]PTL45980.1 hypothetical protein C5Y97_03865 [Blastopirellula marina]